MQQHNFQSLGNISVDWELRLSSSFFPNRTIDIAIAMLQKQENPFIMKLLDKQSNYVESEFCVVMIKEKSNTFWFSRKRWFKLKLHKWLTRQGSPIHDFYFSWGCSVKAAQFISQYSSPWNDGLQSVLRYKPNIFALNSGERNHQIMNPVDHLPYKLYKIISCLEHVWQ